MSRKLRLDGGHLSRHAPGDQRDDFFRDDAFRTRRIPLTQSGSIAAIVIAGIILGGGGSRLIVLLRKSPVRSERLFQFEPDDRVNFVPLGGG